MAKEVMIVYQDCPLCGRRREWGEKQTQVANTHGYEIRKVPFSTPEGGELIHEAVLEHGITTMPFFTDGEHFALSMEKLVEQIEGEATEKMEETTEGEADAAETLAGEMTDSENLKRVKVTEDGEGEDKPRSSAARKRKAKVARNGDAS